MKPYDKETIIDSYMEAYSFFISRVNEWTKDNLWHMWTKELPDDEVDEWTAYIKGSKYLS